METIGTKFISHTLEAVIKATKTIYIKKSKIKSSLL